MNVTSCLAVMAVMILAGGCAAPTITPPPAVPPATAQGTAVETHATLKDALLSAAPPAAAKTLATVEKVASTPIPKAPEVPAVTQAAPVMPTKAAVAATVKTEAAAAAKSTLAKVAPALPVPPLRPVVYPATNGHVTFDHKKHAAKNPCGSCHQSTPIAKIAIDKEKAHQMCKGCHQQSGAGPTNCAGCHKK